MAKSEFEKAIEKQNKENKKLAEKEGSAVLKMTMG